jgi:hypothetical protein
MLDLKALFGSLLRILTAAAFLVTVALVAWGAVHSWLDVRAKKSRHRENKRP